MLALGHYRGLRFDRLSCAGAGTSFGGIYLILMVTKGGLGATMSTLDEGGLKPFWRRNMRFKKKA